jgi:tetratricopeptide (TPR) repeat protein
MPSGARALLTSYDRGDYAAVDASLAQVVSLESFQAELAAAVNALPQRSVAPDVERKRLVAAAVAVEGAARLVMAGNRDVGSLVEWACSLVRLNRPSEAERAWHRATIAVGSSVASNVFLTLHISHASVRFPDEPRVLLARAFLADRLTFPDPRDGRTLFDRSADSGMNPLLTVGDFEKAMRHAEVRAEASLRLGYLWQRLGRLHESLERLRDVEALTDDPYLRYLAFLILGRTLDAMNRHDDAAAAYGRAVSAMPGAQSAGLAYAAALLRTGRTAEAERAARTVVTAPSVDDPWMSYGQGDARLWPSLRDRLREALRR